MKKSSFVAAAAVAVAVAAQPAKAAVIEVTSASAFGANDSINWQQMGVFSTLANSPMTVSSTSGLSVVATSAAGFEAGQAVTSLSQPTSGNDIGNFAPGATLLWGNTNIITLSFASPIQGVGAQLSGDYVGPFNGTVTAYDGSTALGTFTESGNTSIGPDNSAIFLGVLSDGPDITSVTYTLNPSWETLTLGNVSLVDSTVNSAPEPASLALLGIGLVGLASVRRQSRQEKCTILPML